MDIDKRPKYLKSVFKKKKEEGVGGGDFLFSPLLGIENFNKFKPNWATARESHT